MAKVKQTKQKVKFCCTSCGYEHAKWNGQCSGCKEWNTLVEWVEPTEPISQLRATVMAGGTNKPESLDTISEQDYPGFSTGLEELDRVLGGKLAQDQVVLIAAEPGTGKSTLLLQASGHIANTRGKVLYCTGEESQRQIKNRAVRLGISSSDLYIYNTENLSEIIQEVERVNPAFLVADSINHLYNPEESGAQGSTGQIVSCAKAFVTIAKTKQIPIFIVGHVTKDDSIAGPKKLEHVIDTTLFLESDKNTGFRVLRSLKNRYGDTTEIGMFKMESEGMVEIKNPSEYLIANRSEEESGSAIICMGGQRPMLIEVQSLAVPTGYDNAIPRRTSSGFNRNNSNILIAVLEKKCKVPLGSKDVYIKVVGGVTVDEPGADLGVAMAIASSERDIPIDANTVIVGEVGLAGEIRPIRDIESITKEVEKNGFNQLVLPEKNLEAAKKMAKKLKLIPVKKVDEAINLLLGPRIKKSQANL